MKSEIIKNIPIINYSIPKKKKSNSYNRITIIIIAHKNKDAGRHYSPSAFCSAAAASVVSSLAAGCVASVVFVAASGAACVSGVVSEAAGVVSAPVVAVASAGASLSFGLASVEGLAVEDEQPIWDSVNSERK